MMYECMIEANFLSLYIYYFSIDKEKKIEQIYIKSTWETHTKP